MQGLCSVGYLFLEGKPGSVSFGDFSALWVGNVRMDKCICAHQMLPLS